MRGMDNRGKGMDYRVQRYGKPCRGVWILVRQVWTIVLRLWTIVQRVWIFARRSGNIVRRLRVLEHKVEQRAELLLLLVAEAEVRRHRRGDHLRVRVCVVYVGVDVGARACAFTCLQMCVCLRAHAWSGGWVGSAQRGPALLAHQVARDEERDVCDEQQRDEPCQRLVRQPRQPTGWRAERIAARREGVA